MTYCVKCTWQIDRQQSTTNTILVLVAIVYCYTDINKYTSWIYLCFVKPFCALDKNRLKGQCHEIFCFWFFLESVSRKPLIIPLGPFRIFSKIRWDIRSSRFATGVNDTGGKWKTHSSRKIFIILFGHLWVVELTFIYIFAFKFTLRCLQPDIVAIICHWRRWHQWQICPGIVDTGGKFATGIRYSVKFYKMRKFTLDAPWLYKLKSTGGRWTNILWICSSVFYHYTTGAHVLEAKF